MNLTETLDKLVKVAPPLIYHYFTPECCIAATRIAMEVLQALGFQTRAQPTAFVVYTRNLWNRRHQFDGRFLDGEWSVGVGEDRPSIEAHLKPNGYNGHLVCMASNGSGVESLVDLSVGQASRPHRGIDLPPAWHWQFEKWPLIRGCNTMVFHYRPKVNLSYTQARDWTIWSRTDPLIEDILKEFNK